MQEIKTLIEEVKEELVDMTEDLKQKEIRLRKELAQIRAENASNDRVVKKNRDFSLGLPTDTTHKAKTASADCPDVVFCYPLIVVDEKKTFPSEVIL